MTDQISQTRTTGDDVRRDPDVIQREIEETRAELARTVDLIAERLSPRRAATRGATKVKAGIDGVFHKDDGANDVHVQVPHAEAGTAQAERGIRTVSLPASSGTGRELRKDRVAIALAALAAFTTLIVVVRHHRR